MNVIIQHERTQNLYRVGKALKLVIAGRFYAVTPYLPLVKNQDTLYLRDEGKFGNFKPVEGEVHAATAEFYLGLFKEIKYKGLGSDGEWQTVRPEQIVTINALP